jgi:hypothetical protein
MSRKSLIICLVVLVLMVAGVGVAVALLYSGSGQTKAEALQVPDENRYLLLPAVPSDAAAVFCFGDVEDVELGAFSRQILDAAGDARAIVSFHHSGKALVPLYIVDAGKASDIPSEIESAVIAAAGANAMYSEVVNCSSVDGVRKALAGRSLVIVSAHENLVKSSVRHLRSGESIADAPGFAEAAASVGGNDVAFIANAYSQKIISSLMMKKYISYSSFFSHFADWIVFSVKDGFRFDGAAVYAKDEDDFMAVLQASEPAVSSLSSVIPSYTLFALSLPMKDVDAYIAAYESFVDSGQHLAGYRARQKELSASAGMPVADFIKIARISEVSKATFKVAGGMESVNLIKIGKEALDVLCPEAAERGYVPAVHQYRFKGFLASVFGNIFSLSDESCCTYAGGWLISGSRAAVEEYVADGALEYTLADKMKDAGSEDLLAAAPSVFVSYFSFTEDKDALAGFFSKDFLAYVSSVTDGADYCPLVGRVSKAKKGMALSMELGRATVKRSKAPVVERDTTVVVPDGPYQVKNSGTGKMNKFYQNSHLSLCLNEDGKDLWGIPFQHKICGMANTIDYYANGKLQILFGAADKIYLIDRLGRFVSGFPVSVGKEILLGPEPYDFNGVNKYNVMVLHKDNSLEMYNLKGIKPESWKGIKVEETIKSLPEKIAVGGKSYWVVRTSVQTLIFPLMGGDALTVFEGDKMIRPDSEIRVIDAATVGFDCYDGKQRSLKF